MVKFEFYVDTSVFGFYFEKIYKEKKVITENFFKMVKTGIIGIFISELVLLEINKIYEKNLKENLLNLLKDLKPDVLPYNKKIDEIALKIIKMNVIPEKYIDDARHISYAIFYQLDGIISWNMKHIVKLSTKRAINSICSLEGFKLIEILTPEEVIYED